MADIDELTQQVKDHPDDRERRWLLAKQLYKANQYEQALEHLLVLKKQWPLKLNVSRYLAAAYYRLEKFDESIAVLQGVLDDWPKEVPLREQLARVLTMAGRRDEAVKVWEDIVRIQPEHPRAKELLAHIPQKSTQPPGEKPAQLSDRELGISSGTGIICPNCGALNTEEFERCWKCHAILIGGDVPFLELTPSPTPRPAPLDLSRPWHIGGGIATGVLLLLGAYFAIRQAGSSATVEGVGAVAHRVSELLGSELLLARIVIGVTLLVFWPVWLWVAASLTKAEDASLLTIGITGVFLASAAHLILWAPIQTSVWLLAILVLVSFTPIAMTFNAEWMRSAALWAIQAILVVTTLLAALSAMEGTAVISELPAVIGYAKVQDAQPDAGRYPVGSFRTPTEKPMRWVSSGSTWLDQKDGVIAFEIRPVTQTSSLVVDFKDDTGTLYYNHVDKSPFIFTYRVTPGRIYRLGLNLGPGATETVNVDVAVHGVLKPQIAQ